MEKIAIDVGGVLIQKKILSGADTNFDINNVLWLPGSLQAVEELSKFYDLYILSFCGKKTEMETREALGAIQHFIPKEKWLFTRKREHKVKQMLTNHITTLIDDTQQIIEWVTNAKLKGIHFGSSEYPTWSSIVQTLTPT